MSLQKNVASQKIAVYAYDTAADAPKTGDAANITAEISKDFGASAATNDANPTELDATDHPGIYVFDLTQAETNADVVVISPVSSTADIRIEPVQVFTTEVPADVAAVQASVDALENISAAEVNAEVDTALAEYDPPTNTEFEARTLAAASYATAATQATMDGKLDTLLTRITSTLFSGITSLAEWLGLMAGKQTGDATARTELRATGAGSGTFDEAADSQEALRDRGDAAWITATGFSTLDEAAIRDAVGLSSANLDTQLGSIASAVAASAIRTALGLSSANLDTQLADLPTNAELSAALGDLNDPTASAIATAVLDSVIEGAVTLKQSLQLANAANAGKASGMGTTSVAIRDLGDTKDRIAATVDADGNRSAVTPSYD